MNLLWLGPRRGKAENFFHSQGYCVRSFVEDLSPDDPVWSWMNYTVSFGYKHIIDKEIAQKYIGKITNLHISYLPWNRGADPNFWSILENTRKGVTFHLIDEGIDTGDIIKQCEVDIKLNDTLKSSYDQLSIAAEKLLIENWHDYVCGLIKPTKQIGEGSTHQTKDKIPWLHLLENDGWNTPVIRIQGAALQKF